MTPEMWQQLIDAGVTIVLALLIPLLTAGINVLLKRAALDKNLIVQGAVRNGIAYAEEYGARFLKAQGVKLDPTAKLNAAIDRIIERVPDMTPAEAQKQITEELVKVGLGASATVRGPV